MKPVFAFLPHVLFALLLSAGSAALGAQSKILQSPGAESVKFPAAHFYKLSDPDGLRVEGDYLVAEKAEQYAAYQITFQEPGQYYLYFNNLNNGWIANSIFVPSDIGNSPQRFEKWDGLTSSNKEVSWTILAQEAGEGVLPTNTEGDSANSDLTVGPYLVEEVGTDVLVLVSRETGIRWQEFVLSRNSSLSAAELEALAYAETAPADPVDLPFEVAQDYPGEDGYRLWMRYDLIDNVAKRQAYGKLCSKLHLPGGNPTLAAAREELNRGLNGLLFGNQILAGGNGTADYAGGASAGRISLEEAAGPGMIIAGTPGSSPAIAALNLDLSDMGPEGYLLRKIESTGGGGMLIIAANEPIGVLYGSFALLRHLQTRQSLDGLDVRSIPDLDFRVLNHWDNPDGTVERGYAGKSLFWGDDRWDGNNLKPVAALRLKDYARACASLGLNATVLNNVNARPQNLAPDGLEKTAKIANILRPYGIRVGLVPLFNLPMHLGELDTANPTDPAVIAWWENKAEEIYQMIPDFLGFLAKADSEGRPGPHTYGLTHADGANMLANALKPYGGIVMWRSFSVPTPDFYPETPSRPVGVFHSWKTFAPLDGDFTDNVFVQSKADPRGFQPREIYNPLLSTLTESKSMLEIQVTQEYLGHEIHFTYLGEKWREKLDIDTLAQGPGSTVARIIDGTLFDFGMTGMAGVASAGDDRNWTGHHLLQVNWYAFGRLAWDIGLSAEAIAWEWTRMTFDNDPETAAAIVDILLGSHETAVNYRLPLGMIMNYGNNVAALELIQRSHYGPRMRNYSMPTADAIGRDRTASGENMVAQFPEAYGAMLSNLETCPPEYLLAFHRVSWDHELGTGRTVWEEMVYRYNLGVAQVEAMEQQWQSLKGKIDERRWRQVAYRFKQQVIDARRWRDVSLSHYSDINGRPVPTMEQELSP